MNEETAQPTRRATLPRILLTIVALNVGVNVLLWLLRQYAPDLLPESLRKSGAAIETPDSTITPPKEYPIVI